MPRRTPVFRTLVDARAYVRANRGEGVECPCCDQYARVYERSLNYAMARFLIWLVKAYESCARWWSVNDGPLIQNRKGGGDFAKMEHWGLIISCPNEDSTKRMSGFWRPTKRGIDFVYRRIQVPVRIHLYHNQVVGWSPEMTTVVEALGKKFDYAELMRRPV